MNPQPPQNHAQPEDTGHRSPSTEQHRAQSKGVAHIQCAVLTVSDTRSLEDDRGGSLLVELLLGAGHRIERRDLVRDEVEPIRDWALQVLEGGSEVLLVTGGSGIGPRDVSPEALRPLLSKEMPGFGEVFRMLSWEEVGAATVLSRAFAGIMERVAKGEETRRALLFVLPGSTNAVRLAMEKLILPDLSHLVREARGRGAS